MRMGGEEKEPRKRAGTEIVKIVKELGKIGNLTIKNHQS